MAQHNDPNDTSNVELPEQLIPDDACNSLKQTFAGFKNTVELHLYFEDDARDVFTRFTKQLVREFAACSSKLSVVMHGSAESKQLAGPKERPLLAIKAAGQDKAAFNMIGAPLGEEGRAVVQGIVLAGSGESSLSKAARDTLAKLKYKREIKVFGTGSCPYCPGQMVLAASFAMERPDAITAYAIAADQFPDFARSYNVGGVPHTVINEKYSVVGMMPDEPFAAFMLDLSAASLGAYAQAAQNLPAAPTAAEEVAVGAELPTEPASKPATEPVTEQPLPMGMDLPLAPQAASSPVATPSAAPEAAPAHAPSFGGAAPVENYGVMLEKGDEFAPDLLVLGGGPAGLAAATFGGRAGLNVTVLDFGMLGGQVALTPVIENYPGFKAISGSQLVNNFIEQAKEYAHLRANIQITNLEAKDGLFIAHTSNGQYKGRSLLIATGASWRKLGVPGEAIFSGRGVHYCASCDGYMYPSKKIAVVGGGNAALTDALHLRNLGIDVTIIHRRNSFRAEQALINAVEKHGIKILWNATITEIHGQDKVNAITVKDTISNAMSELELDAVFVAIGHDPNSRPAMAVGAKLNHDRTIHVDASMRTSTPKVYAAGDVIGGFKQVVTAVSAGAKAANAAFEDLQKD